MNKKYSPKTIHLTGKGLEKVLGELEAKVMDLIWEAGSVTARFITDKLAEQKRDLSFNSIMTILNRLVDKKILKKGSKDGMYVFIPTMTQEDFSKSVTHDILTALVNDPALFSAAHFAELASGLDPETLNKLKKFIKKTKS